VATQLQLKNIFLKNDEFIARRTTTSLLKFPLRMKQMDALMVWQLGSNKIAFPPSSCF
jgi:hypothetical protein